VGIDVMQLEFCWIEGFSGIGRLAAGCSSVPTSMELLAADIYQSLWVYDDA
jgi:hypothetical protein